MKIAHRFDLSGPTVPKDLRRATPSILVVHRNTVGPDVDSVASWFRDPPKGNEQFGSRLFPYHFFIDDNNGVGDVTVSQVHPLDVISPHAYGMNGAGVGISLNIDGRVKAPSAQMSHALAELLSALMVVLKTKTIVGHSLQKGCPGKLVDLVWISNLAREKKPDQDLVSSIVRHWESSQ
jgi:hypothetical protein